MKKTNIIELKNIEKNFGDKEVLKKISLKINEGDFVTLLGPSGSGKTTALRLIGGFDWPTRGEIKFNGVDVKELPPYKRFTNTIFQNYALFPHLNVLKNIQYGLKLKRYALENIPKSKYSLLAKKEKKWKLIAEKKMKELDFKQQQALQVLNETNKNSRKYKKERKWYDDMDFYYSYWENYVSLKKDNFSKRYLTRKITKDELDKLSNSIIKKVGLEGNEEKSISQLSGGMQQRVALARAIVTEPKVLLLDEPLSALDLKIRRQMQMELKELHKRLGITFIMVTHDQEEALALSNKVIVMNDGRIEQVGVPKEIYDYPINSWVAKFVGNSNIFTGEVISNKNVTFLGIVLPISKKEFKKETHLDVLIRPEDFTITTRKSKLFGKVLSKTYKGMMYEYIIRINKNTQIFIQSIKALKVGDSVNLSFAIEDVHLMIRRKDN